jgi:hypothetical protein
MHEFSGKLRHAAAICCLFFMVGTLKAAEDKNAVVQPDPTRIIIECEDMKGVAQDKFGPGAGWQVGRWGQDLYQNMIFGGVWSSRLGNAMTDNGDNFAEATSEIDVPADGTYKVWAKYECPPFFNYAFGIKIEPIGTKGAAIFDKTYGLLDSPKHFSFNKKLLVGSLFWSWGIDHDAAEGYEVKLTKGRYLVTLYKTKCPAPAGARSLDTIMLTSDLSEMSAPKVPRYPLLDELRRANHVYFRFRNTGSAPINVVWGHMNHREPNYGVSGPDRELVKFFDEGGKLLVGGKGGDWTEPIAPGAVSPWYDLGPTMNTESTSPFDIRGTLPGGKPSDPSTPIGVDIALEPNAKKILKSFDIAPGEASLTFLVQPDLFRPAGVEFTKKIDEIYRDAAKELNSEPRLGPLPKKLRITGITGPIRDGMPSASDINVGMTFREALGLNTIMLNHPKYVASVPAVLDWAKKHDGIVERSLSFKHTQDPQKVIKYVKDNNLQNCFHFVSYGDEIGLPAIDVKDTAKVEEFRAYLKARGETPESLGLANWEQVKPLAALSGEVAVQIGVLPKEKQNEEASLTGLKKLYWYSAEFSQKQGIESFAAKTKEIKAALGNEVETSANLGGMHPFYWMSQASFIDSFKGNAMSLAWSEDYTYCQPEGSRLIADFETAYLRKGASYHNTPMRFYCMPHWPGNTPELLMQCAVMEWGQNVKDIDFYTVSPDAWATENYVACRSGMPTWKTVRTISGMAGLIEDHLLPARTEPAKIAMLLSKSSDVWELEGKGQGDVKPGSIATNVSQEERKAIWYALRNAGHRVDMITEDDCKEGLLKNYSVLYVCGQNLDRKAAKAVKDWVNAGGTVFATAGASRKDEFDAALTDLDDVLGRGKQVSYQRYKGPLRARLELLFEKPLDQIKLTTGESFKALCSLEEFESAKTATVLATGKNGKPAWISNTFGKGRAYYTGTLPGQAYLQTGLPVTPCGKGGSQTSPWMTESVSFDPAAAATILYPLQQAAIQPDVKPSAQGVVTNRLKSDKSTVITVVNLGQQINGNLKNVEFEITGAKNVKRAWSCFHSKGSLPMRTSASGIVVTLPTLDTADVIILEQ